jgi:hypothetical protein
MRRRRQFSVFTLSFLDAMACGFGAAVLLFFMIIKNQAPVQAEVTQAERKAEITRIELELREGREMLARLQAQVETTARQIVDTQELTERIEDSVSTNQQALLEAETTSAERARALAALKTDVQAIDAQAKKLRTENPEPSGTAPRAFAGQGDRQYLTGLRVRGERVLILLDASASMLDDTIVNVIRRRNMPDAQKVNSIKWQRALKTVDWLMAQLPVEGHYQVYTFSTGIRPLLEGTEGKWLEVKNTDQLDEAGQQLRKVIPAGGTSLTNAFTAVAAFDPKPDSVLLVTDGLPTQGDSAPLRKTVSPEARLKLFERAVNTLPRGVPINTILFPMEGDPRATSAFWQLAQVTSGSFITPARDWP